MKPQQAARAVVEAYDAWLVSNDICDGLPSLALSMALQDVEQACGVRTPRQVKAIQTVRLAWSHFCNYLNNDPPQQAYEQLEASMAVFREAFALVPRPAGSASGEGTA